MQFGPSEWDHAAMQAGGQGAADAPRAPAGWYPDPNQPGVRRYWDGTAWASPPEAADQPTEVFEGARPPAPPTQTPRSPSDVFGRLAVQPVAFWLALLAAILMIVGAIGTWATALAIISVSGTHGEDGWIVLGAGVLGGLSVWATMREGVWPAVVAALCGLAGAGVAGYDLHRLSGVGTSEFFGHQVQLVHTGWGLYLAVGASVALAGFAAALPFIRSSSGGTAISALIILLAIGVVVTLSQVEVHENNAAERTSLTTQPSTSQAESATTTTSATSSITNEEVQHVLNQYEHAYSGESISALEGLFASSFARKDGTHPTEDREEALATYRTQFSQLQHPSYSLTEVHVTPGAEEATADATYSISSQNGTVGGTITFQIVSNGSSPQIDQMTIRPHP